MMRWYQSFLADAPCQRCQYKLTHKLANKFTHPLTRQMHHHPTLFPFTFNPPHHPVPPSSPPPANKTLTSSPTIETQHAHSLACEQIKLLTSTPSPSQTVTFVLTHRRPPHHSTSRVCAPARQTFISSPHSLTHLTQLKSFKPELPNNMGLRRCGGALVLRW